MFRPILLASAAFVALSTAQASAADVLEELVRNNRIGERSAPLIPARGPVPARALKKHPPRSSGTGSVAAPSAAVAEPTGRGPMEAFLGMLSSTFAKKDDPQEASAPDVPADREKALSLAYAAIADKAVPSGLGKAAARNAGLVSRVADEIGVRRDVAHAVVAAESSYRASARGAAGEYGLTQISCGSAQQLGYSGSCDGLLDPATNLKWGLTHLKLAVAKGGAGCAGVSLHNLGLAAKPRCTDYGRRIVARIKPSGAKTAAVRRGPPQSA